MMRMSIEAVTTMIMTHQKDVMVSSLIGRQVHQIKMQTNLAPDVIVRVMKINIRKTGINHLVRKQVKMITIRPYR